MTIHFSESVGRGVLYCAGSLFRLRCLPDRLRLASSTLRISGRPGVNRGEIRFMATWRSVHLGPVTIGIAVGRSGQVPPTLPPAQRCEVSARTQFVGLVVATLRHWEELTPDEQDARLHDRV